MSLLPATEPTWIETILATYEQGGSDVEVCKAVKTTIVKFNQKVAEDTRFSELVEYGRVLSHAWWMEQARKAINDKTFNTSMWIFVMKNRFGWADKTEAIERIPDELASIEALKQKLSKIMPDIIKQLNPSATDSKLLKDLRSV